MKPRVAIASCLAGEAVRWDGRDKLDRGLVEALEREAELVRVCPEVELGLGVPRPPVELRARRLVVVGTGEELTGRMAEYAARRIGELRAAGVAGYVLKSKSPSCGLGEQPGAFASALRAAWPELPVAQETELATGAARAQFLARVAAYRP